MNEDHQLLREMIANWVKDSANLSISVPEKGIRSARYSGSAIIADFLARHPQFRDIAVQYVDALLAEDLNPKQRERGEAFRRNIIEGA